MNKNRLILIISAILVLILIAIWIIPRTVNIVINGESQSIKTTAWTVSSVLKEGGLEIKPEDSVTPSLDQLMISVKSIQIELARPVEITVTPENKEISLFTYQRNPLELLNQANISYSNDDRLQVNGEAIDPNLELPYIGSYHISVKQAVNIQVIDGSNTEIITSSADTLSQALESASIFLAENDWISQPIDTPLDKDLEITIRRAVPLTILSKDSTFSIMSAAITVGEALNNAGLDLQGLDYSIPEENSAIPEDGNIRIVRVSEEINLTTTNIPYTSDYVKSDQVDLDKTETIQPGEFGLEVTRTRIRYEDGQEISRSEETTWVAKEAKPQIVGRGSKVVVRTMDTPNGTIEYWRTVNVYATSYSPCRSGGDRCYPGTSLGLPVQIGVIGVTRTWYNMMAGQKIYVPGYGIGTIADTGGGVAGQYWIDLGYSDDNYVAWHSNVTIYFLTPVPDYVPWILP
jgi:uncharacterized protein YabE (DUF348 family)